MVDILLIVIIVVCLAAVIVTLGRKFPRLAAINVEHLPQHRQLLVKGRILEQRLLEKTRTRWRQIGKAAKPLTLSFSRAVKRVSVKIEDLEREYQRQRQVQRPDEERRHRIDQILTQADELLEAGGYAEAEKRYIEVISLNEKNLDAYRGLGDVYLGLKEYEQAQEVLAFALKLSDRIGLEVHEREHHERPGRAPSVPRTINSELASIHGDLGEASFGLDRFAVALAHFGEAVRLEPSNPRYLDRYTEVAIAAVERRRAEEGLAKLKQVNPENQKITAFKEAIDKLPR